MKRLLLFTLVLCLSLGIAFDLASFNALATDVPLLTLETLESYNEYIKSNKMPDNFISYDNLKHLGEFDCFVCLSGTEITEDADCFYVFRDKSGFEFCLYVYNSKDKSASKVEIKNHILNFESNDLKTVGDDKTGTWQYDHQGIKYNYIDGQLLSVDWTLNNTRFVLFSGGGGIFLNDLPFAQNSPISKLFYKDTATEAVELMVASDLSDVANSDPKEFSYLWIAIPVGVVALSGLAAVFVFKKKRSNKDF